MRQAGEIYVAHTSEDVAHVVEGNQAPPPGQWVTKLDVDDHQRVATYRHEGRQFVGIARFKNALRSGLFESEASERGRAASEESLADRQSSFGLANYSIAVAVRDFEKT